MTQFFLSHVLFVLLCLVTSYDVFLISWVLKGSNEIYCLDPSEDGWCATCDANATVFTPGYCGSKSFFLL